MSISLHYVALISCVSQKLETPVPVPAEQLYTSVLFKMSLRFARKSLALPDDRIFILSAQHGLLRLSDLVAPYEQSLTTLPTLARAAWSRRVMKQWEQMIPEDATPIYLAGIKYIEFLPTGLTPLAGKQIGQRLAYMKQALLATENNHVR